MIVWETGRGRRAQRRMILWTRYAMCCDKLVAGQERLGTPMRITPGYFRAEGWNTRDPRSDLRHGA